MIVLLKWYRNANSQSILSPLITPFNIFLGFNYCHSRNSQIWQPFVIPVPLGVRYKWIVNQIIDPVHVSHERRHTWRIDETMVVIGIRRRTLPEMDKKRCDIDRQHAAMITTYYTYMHTQRQNVQFSNLWLQIGILSWSFDRHWPANHRMWVRQCIIGKIIAPSLCMLITDTAGFRNTRTYLGNFTKDD